MPTEDEIRGLKRELASSGVRRDPARRSAILAALGEPGGDAQPVEKRAPKKAAAKKPDAAKGE